MVSIVDMRVGTRRVVAKAKIMTWQNKIVAKCLMLTNINLWMGSGLYLQNICVGWQWICRICRACVTIECAMRIYG